MARLARVLAAGAVAALLAGAAARAQEAPPPFLIINQEQLLTGSEAGRRLLADEERERDTLRADARALDAAFEEEERRLTEQRPDLDPAEFRRLSDEFDARVVQARSDQDSRSAALAQEFDQRRRAFYARVAPILVTLMDRHGAKAILDENSVLLADQSLNITAAVIAEIDAHARAGATRGGGRGAAAAGRGQRGRKLAMALAIDPALPQADILTIKRMIPHRYPFLLIDRVVNIAVNRSAVGIKNVTVNEPHFQGHFPVIPVMPGVLIIEAMAQTSAVLVVETLGVIDQKLLVYFMSIEEAKFRAPVAPGDTLELHVDTVRGRGKIWKFRGEAKVGDKLCAEAVFAAMILTEDEASTKG